MKPDHTDAFWDALKGLVEGAHYLGSLSSSPHDERTAKARTSSRMRRHARTLYQLTHGGMDELARQQMKDLLGDPA